MQVSIAGALAAGIAGAAAGVGVMGVANHFTHARTLWPTPVCAHCGGRSPARSWTPLIGPLIARGRCISCPKGGAWRLALLVQVVGAALAVLLYLRYGVSLMLVSAGLETAVLLTVAVVDLQHRLIPSMLVYPTILVALAFSPAWPNLGLISSLMGGALAFGLFFGLALVARFAYGEGALGDGDVTLATLIGVICGYPMVVLALTLGACAGGIGGLLMVLLRRSPLGSTIPYGPFLAMGVVYVLLIGNTTHALNALP